VTRDEALQSVLAGEHAAVYAYGVVGAQLAAASDVRAARQAFALHQARRDHVAALISQAGGTPVGTLAGYDLGGPVTTHDAARALAARVEASTTGPYADLVAASSGALRNAAAGWLVDASVRAVHWGGLPVPFPGLPERSAAAASSTAASPS
jgi:hypothetical protein